LAYSETQKKKKKYYVEALARGLRILELFEELPNPSLSEIALRLDIDTSTAFRSVHTLEEMGFLRRNSETKRYQPGLRILRLGFATLNSLEVTEVAQPYLVALSNQTGENTALAVREGAEIVFVARCPTQQLMSTNLHLGSRLPLYCTSLGRILLMDFSRQELLDLLGEGPYPKLGPNTIANMDDLEIELERARQQGYAINDEELTTGLRAVAAPITDRTGAVVAAMNVSAFSARVSRSQLEMSLAPMLVETTRQISFALGANLHQMTPALVLSN